MRRGILVALLVNGLLLCVVCLKELSVAQAGGELVATENGDTNGDGERDIGDAIYLVRWLFRGGPGPVALETDDAALAETQAALASCSEDLAVVEATLAERDAGRDELLAALAAAEARIAELEVTGCSDPEANNYDCTANVDDGSCEYDLEGFTFSIVNEQGYAEYTHVSTGIVFVRLAGCETLEPFLIAKHECTQGEYEAVMGVNPSQFTGDARQPVEQVSWDDLKAADGFLARTGLSLPSEAQWECACRGGTTTHFSWGDQCVDAGMNFCATADDHMWYGGNLGGTTHPVGAKLPNPFGLHDVHGNVFEWCEDEYTSGTRVIRGGTFFSPVGECLSGFRGNTPQDNRNGGLGFRPVRPSVAARPGCTDPEATNYDSGATVDDGSCEHALVAPGCTDSAAENYDPCATEDDGSCEYAPTIPEGFTYAGENAQGYKEYTHDQTDIVFVLLPGGSVVMGSPECEQDHFGEEGPVHVVSLSPFLIAKYETTQAQYAQVMQGHATLSPNPSRFIGDDRPVEQVSWDDLHASDGFLALTGLSLPSEAQWEYACRAGQQGSYSGTGILDEMGWYFDNSGSETHPVGTKAANQFGLHDMHGNVWEWCEDVFDANFYGTLAAAGPDPVSTAGSGLRVSRGGSWNGFARTCRSAFRYGNHPGFRYSFGFRPLRPLP